MVYLKIETACIDPLICDVGLKVLNIIENIESWKLPYNKDEYKLGIVCYYVEYPEVYERAMLRCFSEYFRQKFPWKKVVLVSV